MAKRQSKKDYTRKVPLKAIAAAEREVGEIVQFANGMYYTVKRIDEKAGVVYLLRVGPLE